MVERCPPHRNGLPSQAGLAGLGPREERPARAYLDPAYLARPASAGGMPGGADRHAAARSGDTPGAEGAAREDRREGRHPDRTEEGKATARSSRRSRRRPRGASCTGATRTAPTWIGSARRSRKPMAVGRRGCSTRSPAAARSPSRRCGWDARRRPSTSIRSPGSSSSAPWNTPRSSRDRFDRFRSSPSNPPSSWRAYLKDSAKLTKKRRSPRRLSKFDARPLPAARCRPGVARPGLGLVGAPAGAEGTRCFYPTIDGKPTVAYLWARTVTCKNCRTTIPLLKTRWLCKKRKTSGSSSRWNRTPTRRGSSSASRTTYRS